MDAGLADACARALHTWSPAGELQAGGDAVRVILAGLGWRRLAWLLGRPIIGACLRAGYRVVARNRRFFARFLFTQE